MDKISLSEVQQRRLHKIQSNLKNPKSPQLDGLSKTQTPQQRISSNLST